MLPGCRDVSAEEIQGSEPPAMTSLTCEIFTIKYDEKVPG